MSVLVTVSVAVLCAGLDADQHYVPVITPYTESVATMFGVVGVTVTVSIMVDWLAVTVTCAYEEQS